MTYYLANEILSNITNRKPILDEYYRKTSLNGQNLRNKSPGT